MATINIVAEKKAYKRFVAEGMTPEGACALIGNLEAESDGFYPWRLEYLCQRRLRENGKNYTQEEYTIALDTGKISCEEFLHPLPGKQFGYGLAQWTSPSRKSGLWNLAHQRGVSMADLDTQLDFLMQELRISYPSVLRVLKTTASIRTASDTVLKKFEQPTDTSEAVCAGRFSRGQKFYNTYMVTGNVSEREESTMTEKELRQKVVDTATAWLGYKESNGSHKKIIDLYNTHKPLARGYAVRYTDAWCATFVSAVAIKLGLTDIMPTECGCGEMIRLYQKLGRWQESDAYVPQPGDIIMYDWNDSGKGDCTGEPEHVGIVVSVTGNQIKVIEGNKSDAVAYRDIAVNGRYIRGYCLPNYANRAKGSGATPAAPSQTAESESHGNTLNTAPQWTGASTINGLNVRTYAGTEYPNIKSYPTLNKGNLVDVCDSVKAVNGDKWYYIRIAGRTYGFVHSKYIKDTGKKDNTTMNSTTPVPSTNPVNPILKQCAKFQAQLSADLAADKSWEYHNPSKYLEEQWANAIKKGKRACNCALLARWALKEAGLIPQTTGIFYGAKGGTIKWGSGTKEAVSKTCDIIKVQTKTVKELIASGELLPGDIVTYVDLQHTNIYAGGGKWYDAGHAYCSGSGEGAKYKSWYGAGTCDGQKVGYIIRQKGSGNTAVSTAQYIVQAGSYKSKANADKQAAKIKAAGFDAIVKPGDDRQYKIQCGVFKDRDLAEALVKKLKAKGFPAIIK